VPKVWRAPVSRDVILAAAVTAYGLLVTFVRIGDGTIYHGPRLPNAILSVLVTSTLAWRRTRPLLALTWIFAVFAVSFADERAPDAPQPSIDTLGRLADTVRAAGLDVDLAIGGEVRPLPPGLELSVYRIVQEALTNVLKHARASKARVLVDYRPGAVTIDVVDDGTARAASGAQDGHGLVGMRQRARVFGGTTTAGPAPGGGWQVRAELPAEPGQAELPAEPAHGELTA
jgi:Histidine kinase-, DNA gyrase B-, and HSP90-like ATPase